MNNKVKKQKHGHWYICTKCNADICDCANKWCFDCGKVRPLNNKVEGR